MSRVLKIVVGAAVAALVLGVGGSWVYINLIRDDAPDRLALSGDATATTAPGDGVTTTTAAAAYVYPETDAVTTAAPTTAAAGTTAAATDAGAGIDGTWTPTDASQLGYRVQEILFGQDTEGVGRTNAITGSLTAQGATITAAEFTVDMTTLRSDDQRRDNQVNGRILQTADFPTATFRLTQPIELGTLPAVATPVRVDGTGELTLKGTTKLVTIPLQAQLTAAGTIEVQGATTVVFADWGIANPSTGPIQTEDRGELEFLLVFTRG